MSRKLVRDSSTPDIFSELDSVLHNLELTMLRQVNAFLKPAASVEQAKTLLARIPVERRL